MTEATNEAIVKTLIKYQAAKKGRQSQESKLKLAQEAYGVFGDPRQEELSSDSFNPRSGGIEVQRFKNLLNASELEDAVAMRDRYRNECKDLLEKLSDLGITDIS